MLYVMTLGHIKLAIVVIVHPQKNYISRQSRHIKREGMQLPYIQHRWRNSIFTGHNSPQTCITTQFCTHPLFNNSHGNKGITGTFLDFTDYTILPLFFMPSAKWNGTYYIPSRKGCLQYFHLWEVLSWCTNWNRPQINRRGRNVYTKRKEFKHMQTPKNINWKKQNKRFIRFWTYSVTPTH